MSIAPVVRSIATRAAPARAFDLFTARMGEWWPSGRTIGAAPHSTIVLEPLPGGRWFERDADGQETDWGEVLAWDPPRAVLLAWRIDAAFRFDPAVHTEVAITFVPTVDGGTLVTLEHRRLEGLGTDAAVTRERLDGGWPSRLANFASFADRS